MPKKLTRQEANDTCDGLRAAIASLKSCHRGEVENEATILRRQIKTVQDFQLHRHCQLLEKRRHNLVKEAERVLSQRGN